MSAQAARRTFNPPAPPRAMPTTTSRVYVAHDVNDDADSAVVHVDTFEVVDQGQNQGNEASDRMINRAARRHDGGSDDETPQDDVNALYPIHRDQIPKIMRLTLAATGFLTLVTSPGKPNKPVEFLQLERAAFHSSAAPRPAAAADAHHACRVL